MKTRAVILAGGEGTRLSALTAKRAKPAVPFAGKYRIIDFTLSNCCNSGIFDVVILTQYRPHSLNDHIGRGQPWDLDRNFTGGVTMLQPYKGRKDTDWYSGTADAVYQNLNWVMQDRPSPPEYILILSGDHIYEMNYDDLVNYHISKNADMTICSISVPIEEASRFGILDVDSKNRVKEFLEKPANPPGNNASMGVYVFSAKVLEQMLMEDAKRAGSTHDFGKDLIPRMVAQGMKVFAYPFSGYWVDVGTLDAYWETHMDLLARPSPINLNNRKWVIHTRSEERPPMVIETGTEIKDSMITNGAVICEGAIVERSILSPGVYIGPHAVVRESIILTDATVEANAVVERTIIDKNAVIGIGAKVGKITDKANLGITVIGKGAHVPAGYSIGRNVVLGTDLRPEDFGAFASNKTVPDGTKIINEAKD